MLSIFAPGYIAGSIVQRLLVAGHIVRATVRDPSAEHRLTHLRCLPGADDRLQFFKVLFVAGTGLVRFSTLPIQALQ